MDKPVTQLTETELKQAITEAVRDAMREWWIEKNTMLQEAAEEQRKQRRVPAPRF